MLSAKSRVTRLSNTGRDSCVWVGLYAWTGSPNLVMPLSTISFSTPPDCGVSAAVGDEAGVGVGLGVAAPVGAAVGAGGAVVTGGVLGLAQENNNMLAASTMANQKWTFLFICHSSLD